MDYQGSFKDDLDGDIVFEPVEPMFRCLEDAGNSEYTAWFGYVNNNPNNVYITAFTENSLMNGTEIDNTLTRPTKFITGNVDFAMSLG